MAIEVRIPTILRTYTGGEKAVDGAGSTLTVQQANVTGNANSGELDMLSAEGIGGAATIAGTTAGTGTGGFVTLSGSAGATIIVASHELERAGSLATRAVDVVAGQVVAVAT